MISGIFHSGSGLGNQLHRYVATRALALDKGYKFSMVAPENFKGKSFMNLEMGVEAHTGYITESPSGKVVPQLWDITQQRDLLYDKNFTHVWEEKTPYYNPEFNFIEDNTIIDGEFQDERYFEKYIGGYPFVNQVDKWLKVEPIAIRDETLAIGFRGGEFSRFPELFLTPEYWAQGIGLMNEIYKGTKSCEVHTDDPELAEKFFGGPSFPSKIINDIGINWRSMRYAKYAIIANSSFYILPRLLKHMEDPNAVTIAPRYWARRNTKEWSMPQNYYKNFTYI